LPRLLVALKVNPWFHLTPAGFGSSLAVLLFFSAVVFAQSQSGIDLTAIDKTADPCNDFYRYACGGWLKANPIPPEEATWGRFDVLFENNQKILRSILEDSAAHQERSATDQQVGAFYQSCMNEDRIEALGGAPLQPELDRIAAINTRANLLAEIARLHDLQVQVFFSFSPEPDPDNARRNIANLDQGGLGLPEKDFYFRSDSHSEEIRQKYVAHIARMLELSGIESSVAAKESAEILHIETALAKGSLDITARRDPKLLVHRTSLTELAAQSPAFSFDTYFRAIQAPKFSTLNVSVPSFEKTLNDLLASEPLPNLKHYLAWHYIRASGPLLSHAFVDENFDFYSRALTGASQLRPRWKRCVSATDDELGEALGRLFVERTHAEEGKAHTLQIVMGIEEQMKRDINSITWMSSITKKRALEKLAAVTRKIGYPDHWRDYSSVHIESTDYFGNWYRANQFESRREIAKIGQPVDRNEWQMTPPTVNAYYEPSENNINFPAGILQPPFYSNDARDSVNYGAVGSVIGHELTHGFDDEGRQFDGDGNLKDWWTKNDRDRFAKLSNCFVNQYGGYSPVPGVELNGQLTLGENTADNGGIRLAYLALLDVLAKKAVPISQMQDGYTQTQQFFLGFAQAWCENQRPEAARLQAQTDPHAPAQFRVDGTVSNMPEFGKAFSCGPSDKMMAVKACRVW
jgi:endothelin-converting enzyme/putative endopeptidase